MMDALKSFKTDSNAFYDELIKYCNSNNITAYRLSKYGNISITYAYNLMNGRMKKPSLNVMKKIIEGFEVNKISTR